jgi:protein-tyrosine phosphatase
MSLIEKARMTGSVHAESTDRLVFRGNSRHGYLDVNVPYISHVYGPFWQGGVEQGVVLPDHFKFVVSLYSLEKYDIRHRLLQHKSYRMNDSVYQSLEKVDEIARKAFEFGQEGDTLIHCQAGLNRSGLVMSRVLQMSGLTPEESVAMIRERRSPYALCNKHFESWTLEHPVQRPGTPEG